MVLRAFSNAGMLLSLFLSCLGVAFAQPPLGELRSSRLVSTEEGEAIVQAAWELRRSLHPKPDCSHFVQVAYTQAGFGYEYAQSRAIFGGIGSFHRVQKPQPGDLVVWQGHVGIVVDPAGHTFYSSVLAGFAIEDYRSNYWTNRGRPRFYPYLVDDPQTARPLACSVAKEDFIERIRRHDSVRADIQRELPRKDPDIETYAPETNNADVRDVLLVSRQEQPSKNEVFTAMLRTMAADEERLQQDRVLESHPSIAVADKVTFDALNWIWLCRNRN